LQVLKIQNGQKNTEKMTHLTLKIIGKVTSIAVLQQTNDISDKKTTNQHLQLV